MCLARWVSERTDTMNPICTYEDIASGTRAVLEIDRYSMVVMLDACDGLAPLNRNVRQQPVSKSRSLSADEGGSRGVLFFRNQGAGGSAAVLVSYSSYYM